MKISTKIKFLVALIGIQLGIVSCFKSEQYPIEPAISNASAVVYGDSAMVSFDFTDGDADIGLAPSDTFGYFAADSFYYYNIYLNYFEKDDNLGWVNGKDIVGDTVAFGYRIKPIEVSSNTEGIKGRIDVMISPQYRNITSSQSDTVRFEILLIDRARHTSNIIQTPELIAP